MPKYLKLARPAVWLFYIVICLEFLFMISPFALYFYASYGPVLNLLHVVPATAWLSGFFLPHFSITSSLGINALKPAGFIIAASGLFLFFFGVIQIYGAKLLRRKEVTGGLYRISRHPQYAALAILGFGVLLIWPRFLVLITYVTMLFLYYALARWEESHCVETYGESYRQYMNRVGFFLPKSLTFWLPSARPWMEKPSAVLILYIVSLVITIGAATGIRNYSIGQLSSYYEQDRAAISPAQIEKNSLKAAVDLALTSENVRKELAEASTGAPWIIYVVPTSWYVPDLPLNRWDEIPTEHQSGHTTPDDYEPGQFKILFTRALTHYPASRGQRIIETAYGRVPIVRVQINLKESEVLAIEDPPKSVVWGDIPTPIF